MNTLKKEKAGFLLSRIRPRPKSLGSDPATTMLSLARPSFLHVLGHLESFHRQHEVEHGAVLRLDVHSINWLALVRFCDDVNFRLHSGGLVKVNCRANLCLDEALSEQRSAECLEILEGVGVVPPPPKLLLFSSDGRCLETDPANIAIASRIGASAQERNFSVCGLYHSRFLLSMSVLIPSKHNAWISVHHNMVCQLCQCKQKTAISDVSYFLTLWIKNFSVPQRNRQFVFIPKIEYKLIAEPRTRASSVRDKLREANLSNLQFPQWSPREESNPHQRLRRALLSPLSYEGNK